MVNNNNVDINEYSYEKIIKEPEILGEKKSQLKNDLKNLATNNYQLFIQNFNTINHTNKNIDVISNEISSLLDHLPGISQSCESFSKVTQNLSENRKSVKNLLNNCPTLLDLLEIPHLMETCVKNNLFEEALQLESFAKKLMKQFPTVKIIDDIIKEFQEIRLLLISNLQQALCRDVSLTDCIKYIGYLRKLSIYKENELKILYLYCREQWFMNKLKSKNNDETEDNIVSYLTRLADRCRTNMFDIITQFTAIFSNDSEDDSNLDDMILHSWIQNKIQMYLTILEKNLLLVKEGSSILYILENSMYFSMSLCRVGIDFRGLLQPLFEKPIFNHFQSQITISTHKFLESLKSYKFPSPKPSLSSNNSNSNNTGSNSNNTSSNSNIIVPPMIILSHQPLAILLNSFLQSFNELKECLPLSLKDQLVLKLKETLVNIISGVQAFYNQSSFNINQEKIFHEFCKIIVEDLLPFVVKSFNLICNQQQQNTNNENISLQPPSLIDLKPLTYSLIKIYSSETLQPLDDFDPNNNNSNISSVENKEVSKESDLVQETLNDIKKEENILAEKITSSFEVINEIKGEESNQNKEITNEPSITLLEDTNNTKVESVPDLLNENKQEESEKIDVIHEIKEEIEKSSQNTKEIINEPSITLIEDNNKESDPDILIVYDIKQEEIVVQEKIDLIHEIKEEIEKSNQNTKEIINEPSITLIEDNTSKVENEMENVNENENNQVLLETIVINNEEIVEGDKMNLDENNESPTTTQNIIEPISNKITDIIYDKAEEKVSEELDHSGLNERHEMNHEISSQVFTTLDTSNVQKEITKEPTFNHNEKEEENKEIDEKQSENQSSLNETNEISNQGFITLDTNNDKIDYVNEKEEDNKNMITQESTENDEKQPENLPSLNDESLENTQINNDSQDNQIQDSTTNETEIF